MNKISVLFLCTSNSARSQMAEAFLRSYAGELFEVYSAGLQPKGIHPLTRQVMKEAGIDMSRHYPKSLTHYLGRVHFSYLITVCDEAEDGCPRAFPGMGHRLHWGFADPASFLGTEEEKVSQFRRIRDEIQQTVEAWADSYRNQIS